MTERGKIVVWWREGIPTLGLGILALLDPNIVVIGLLAGVALVNVVLGILADRDAEHWFTLWRDFGPEWRGVRPPESSETPQ